MTRQMLKCHIHKSTEWLLLRASRALLLSSAVALNLIFIYFSCDLTARMTSAPPKISITSFDDVKEQGEERIFTLKTKT